MDIEPRKVIKKEKNKGLVGESDLRKWQITFEQRCALNIGDTTSIVTRFSWGNIWQGKRCESLT